MKNMPLTIGIILLAVGLIGLVFNQFPVFWMWLFVILGVIVVAWTGLTKKNDNNLEKK